MPRIKTLYSYTDDGGDTLRVQLATSDTLAPALFIMVNDDNVMLDSEALDTLRDTLLELDQE